jgi:hypothetical protein
MQLQRTCEIYVAFFVLQDYVSASGYDVVGFVEGDLIGGNYFSVVGYDHVSTAADAVFFVQNLIRIDKRNVVAQDAPEKKQ